MVCSLPRPTSDRDDAAVAADPGEVLHRQEVLVGGLADHRRFQEGIAKVGQEQHLRRIRCNKLDPRLRDSRLLAHRVHATCTLPLTGLCVRENVIVIACLKICENRSSPRLHPVIVHCLQSRRLRPTTLPLKVRHRSAKLLVLGCVISRIRATSFSAFICCA